MRVYQFRHIRADGQCNRGKSALPGNVLCYHVDMRRTRILLFAIALGLVTAAVAAASGGTIRDPADTGGRFDVQAVSFAQNARTLTFTITMWKPWKISDLQHGAGATPRSAFSSGRSRRSQASTTSPSA